MRSVLRTLLVLLGLVAPFVLLGPVPAAHAQSRVAVTNDQGTAVIDPTYATTLKLSGSGFQSVKGGHGGIYVFFGTVSGTWRPSKGGATGEDYFYVPDSESRSNAGYQRYVAFPGSDTADSANGGVVSAAGRWSTTITVPGATFQAVDRSGATRTIDCRKVTCGIITVGAHGVVNSVNESFTPVRVADLHGGAAPAETPSASAPESSGSTAPSTEVAGEVPTPAAEKGEQAAPTFDVDRSSAVAGRALSFTARGLTPGAQVSAVLDDGVAAAGPFVVGSAGQVTGVVTLPVDLAQGTHELRLFGLPGEDAPTVRFPVTPADDAATASADVETGAEATDDPTSRAGIVFFVVAAVVLAGAVARLLMIRRRRPGSSDA